MDILGTCRRTLVLVALVLPMAGCKVQADTAAVEPRPLPVRVAKPAAAQAPPTISAIGRLEGMDEASLGFVSGGIVRTVRVDIGDPIRAGQVLATQDTTALDAGVRQAEEELARARRDLVRMQGLIERQLVAGQQLDDARTRVEVTEATQRAARFQQRYGSVVAQRDGIVLKRMADPGQVVAAGQPVLVVSSAQQGWRLPVEVADRDAVRLSVGAEAEVTFDAFPGQSFPARIRELGGQAAPGSGAITIDLLLEPTGTALRSGLIGQASIALPAGQSIAVPVTALMEAQARRARVMVVEEGVARERHITLGNLQGNHVEVVEGLAPDAMVIIEGGAWTDAGRPVSILPAR